MSQDKYTKLARGEACQVRIPGVCNGNWETTVLAHYRLSGLCGIGMKPPSLIVGACSSQAQRRDRRAGDGKGRGLRMEPKL